MTSSIYTTFAGHNADLIARRRVERHAAGDGMAWGSESMTPREAAADMGAIVLCEYHDGMVLAELSDRLYMVADVSGPWAVEVATQEDLGWQVDRVIDAAGDPDYRQCVARVLGEMYTIGGHVQVDERDGCTWLDCWDARLLMYVGRDGVRVLRQRVAGGGFAELLRTELTA